MAGMCKLKLHPPITGHPGIGIVVHKEGACGPLTGLDTGDAPGAKEEPENLSCTSIYKLLWTDSGGELQRTISHRLIPSLLLPKESFLTIFINSPTQQPLLKNTLVTHRVLLLPAERAIER